MRKLTEFSFLVALAGFAFFAMSGPFSNVLAQDGSAVATTVSEPETLLLFGAGLGIVGFALMRRRRRD